MESSFLGLSWEASSSLVSLEADLARAGLGLSEAAGARVSGLFFCISPLVKGSGKGPLRCSEDGTTLHFLKNSSVSLSTTSSLVSSPPALMAVTTSPCCLPSTQTPFTSTMRSCSRSPEASAGESGSTARMNWPGLDLSLCRLKP